MNSHHFRLSLLLIEILYTSAEQNEHDQEESLPHYEQIEYDEIFAYRDIGIGLLTNAYLLYTSDKYFVKNRFFLRPVTISGRIFIVPRTARNKKCSCVYFPKNCFFGNPSKITHKDLLQQYPVLHRWLSTA